MARMRQVKSEDLIKAKKALFRKVTFMKLLEFVKTTAILAIALKYLGLIEPLYLYLKYSF